MYDAIIVGARVAGSATGMLLARRGLRVLIVDRATFPSDTMSTHYIHPEGVKLMRTWGLLDELMATGCPPMETTVGRIEHVAFEMDVPTFEDVSFGVCPRRTVLDELMLRAAEKAGAEIRTASSLRERVWENGRVAGVTCESDGARWTERASIVIGADGKRSTVAKMVEAKTYNERPSAAYWYYNYFDGLDVEPGLYFAGTWGGGVNPTHDGAWVVIGGGQIGEFEQAKTDVASTFQRNVATCHPALAEQLAEREPLERFVGTADVPGFFRDVVGEGWTLVGDAGLHKDPITGSGITEAFVHAAILAEELACFFEGTLSMNEALSVYQRRRDAHSTPWYEWTCLTAQMNPIRPEMLELFRQMQTDRAKANAFGMANAGMLSVQEMFARLTSP